MTNAEQFLFLGRCLTPEIAADPALAEAIQSGAVPWQQLFWLAGNHLVTPSLAGSLRRKALFDLLPEEMQNYLDILQTLNRERNRILYRELIHIAQLLNRSGIKPVLLKGVNALLPDQYPGAKDRVLGDLDLMVPADRVGEASAALQADGYLQLSLERVLSRDLIRSHHAAPLLHPNLPVTVELHSRMLRNVQDDARLSARLIAAPVTLPGGKATVLVPDPATRLLHNFLHTQIQDQNHALFSLAHRQLLEFVSLRHWQGQQWDWPVLAKRLRPKRHRALAGYLLAAERWYGQPMPPDLGSSPTGPKFWLNLTERAQAENRWRRLLALYRIPRQLLPRLLTLPYRLLTPPWFALKYRSLRSGEPL
jgi:hypothetical protein